MMWTSLLTGWATRSVLRSHLLVHFITSGLTLCIELQFDFIGLLDNFTSFSIFFPSLYINLSHCHLGRRRNPQVEGHAASSVRLNHHAPTPPRRYTWTLSQWHLVGQWVLCVTLRTDLMDTYTSWPRPYRQVGACVCVEFIVMRFVCLCVSLGAYKCCQNTAQYF